MCVCLKYKKKKKGAWLHPAARSWPGSVRASSLRAGTVGTGGGRGEELLRGKMDACHGRAAGWAPPGCPRAHGAKTHKQKPQQIAGSPFWGGGRRLAEEPQRTWLGAGGRWRPARHRCQEVQNKTSG
uniref:Uncharacterized protein n=1 Tax=Rousettus aegyptiacus TaxID=9407 RepID=A0A7J8CI20_ROUAE|nr:hypothetical protein HJG63_009029 [Rousettus aegyptiacus]